MTISEIKLVSEDLLTVDPRVQRQLDLDRVGRIAESWSDAMVGVLTVSQRTGGEYVVLDGQTRLEAFRLSHPAKDSMRCDIHAGLELSQEAQMFLELNDRKAVTPRDTYRLALVAGERWALDIHAVTTRYGWTMRGNHDGSGLRPFTAVSAARRVYDLDGGASLAKVFATIDTAWGSDKRAVCSATLYGPGLLYARHGDLVSVADVARALGRMTSGEYTAEVGMLKLRRHISVQEAAYLQAVDIYNIKRTTHRLVP